MPPDVVPPKEMAQRATVSVGTLNMWARQGRIPVYRLSRKTLRYSLSEVMAVLGAGAPSQAPAKPELAASA